MKHEVFTVIYLVAMGAIIIGVDVLFLRDQFWWRLGVNVGIVATFTLAYLMSFRSNLKYGVGPGTPGAENYFTLAQSPL